MIIADLTKADPGTEPNLLTALSLHATATAQSVTLVLHHRQSYRLNGNSHTWKLIELGNYDHYSAVRQAVMRELIATLNDKPEGQTVEVFSFHAVVLAVSDDFPTDGNRRLICRHWRDLTGPRTVQHASPEQLAILAEVLRMFPKGVRKTGLRDYLASRSPTFAKDAGGPTISDLLRQAERIGIAVLDYSMDAQNPVVRSKTGDAGEVIVHQTEDPTRLPSSSPSLAASDAKPTSTDESKESHQGLSGQESLVLANASEASGSREPVDARKVGKIRLARYRDILRKTGLGPYAAIRPELYDTLEDLVKEGNRSSAVLIRKTVRRVWKAHDDKGSTKSLLWTDVEGFLFNLLGRQEVLLGQDERALNPKGGAALGIPVKGLKPRWRDLLEAELVFAILDGDRNVTAKEADDAAYVLFGSDEPEDRWVRMDALLGILMETDRIYVDSQGRYLRKTNTEVG